jgi:hypothetical protein
MDKTESYLTQVIVGKRQRLTLGTKVRYEGDGYLALPQTSRLYGALQDVGAFLAGRWHKWAMGVFVVTLVAGIGAGGAWFFLQQNQLENGSVLAGEQPIATPPSNLPIAPAPVPTDPVTAITVAAEPFPMADGAAMERSIATETPSQGAQVPPDGPLPPGSAASGSSVPTRTIPPRHVELSQSPPAVNAKRDVVSNKASGRDREDSPPAVVLDASKDAADKSGASVAQTLSVVKEPASKNAKVVTPTEVGSPVVGTVGTSSTTTRPTIVTIAEDSSYVLITNPSTRLPQKFQVGQKLPSGATVQKIDHSKGVVQIDGQTFGLQ